ncbi:MAG: formate/nitrite transporter family protein [Clostridia bacterium]
MPNRETTNFKTPKLIAQAQLESSVQKAHLPLDKVFILGIFAGLFIAIGASTSLVASHGVSDPGLAKLVAGCVFPIGLMLTILVGGELFTGNCLMIMGVLDKRFKARLMFEKLTIVFFANFIGAIMIVLFVKYSGQLDMGSGALGAYTIKVALGKTTASFSSLLVSGIAANILVCLSVLMAATAIDIVGKLAAIFFPILAFVITGFEHCVANMYYIPAGLLALLNDDYVQVAMDTYGYTAEQLESLNLTNFLLGNLVPVTIGNMIGGMIFLGVPFYIIHRNKKADKVSEESTVQAK